MPPDGGEPASLAAAEVGSPFLEDSPLLVCVFIDGSWESLLVLGLLNLLPSFLCSDVSTPILVRSASSEAGLLLRLLGELSIFSASSIIFHESLSSLLILCSRCGKVVLGLVVGVLHAAWGSSNESLNALRPSRLVWASAAARRLIMRCSRTRRRLMRAACLS